jgi:hypothetical protein
MNININNYFELAFIIIIIFFITKTSKEKIKGEKRKMMLKYMFISF